MFHINFRWFYKQHRKDLKNKRLEVPTVPPAAGETPVLPA